MIAGNHGFVGRNFDGPFTKIRTPQRHQFVRNIPCPPGPLLRKAFDGRRERRVVFVNTEPYHVNAALSPLTRHLNAGIKLHAEPLGGRSGFRDACCRIVIRQRNRRDAQTGRKLHQRRRREFPVACRAVHMKINCHKISFDF